MKNIFLKLIISISFSVTILFSAHGDEKAGIDNHTHDDNKKSDILTLSKKEKKWILNNKVKIGITQWKPMIFSSATKKMDGITSDILKLVFNKVNIKYELINDTWTSHLTNLKENKVDLLPATYYTDKRASFGLYSKSYYNMKEYVFVNKNNLEINNILDLYNKTVSITKSYGALEDFKNRFPNANILLTKSINESIKKVLNGEADAIFNSEIATKYKIQDESIAGLRAISQNIFQEKSLHFFVSKDKPILVGILNKALDSIPQYEINKIKEKWIIEDIIEENHVDKYYEVKLFISISVGIFVIFLISVFIFKRFLPTNFFVNNFNKRIFKVIAFISMVFIIATVVFFVIFALDVNKEKTLQLNKGNLEFVLDNTKNNLDEWIKDHENYLFQVGNNQKFFDKTKALLKLGNKKENILNSVELKNVRSFWYSNEEQLGDLGFFIINKDFINIASKRDVNIGHRNLINIYHPNLLDKVFEGKTVFIPPILSDVNLKNNLMLKDVDERQYSMFFATPIQDDKGTVIAALTQRLNPEHFDNILKSGRVRTSGESYIIDKNGFMLSKSRFNNQLVEIGLLNKGEHAYQKIQVRDPLINLIIAPKTLVNYNNIPLTDMAKKTIESGDRNQQKYTQIYFNMDGYRDYKGVEVFGAGIWNNDLSFGIIAEVNKDEALLEFYKLRQSILIILAFSLVLMVTAIIIFMSIAEKVHNKLLKSNLLLNKTLEAFDHNVIASKTDLKGNITHASKAFCDISGYSNSELIGKNHNIVRHPDMPKKVFKNLWQTIKSGKIWTGEIKNLKKDGGYYWVNATIEPDYDENGETIGYFAIRHDITPQKIIEQQKKEIEKQDKFLLVQSKLAAVGEMIGNIAHQWRQPLATISANTATIKLSIDLDEQLSNEELLDFTKSIDDKCQYLSKTIDDFRSFIKSDNVVLTNIDIKEVISDAINLIKDSFDNNYIEVILDVDSCIFNGNKNILLQCFLNILNNTKDAIVINNVLTEQRYIFITAKKEDNNIIVDFTDSAGGIPEDIIDDIFAPYFSTKDELQGTGLGLYMTHQILEKNLKGAIIAENCEYEYKGNQLKGAKFIVTIPV